MCQAMNSDDLRAVWSLPHPLLSLLPHQAAKTLPSSFLSTLSAHPLPLAPPIFLLNEYLISLAIGLALCWNLWAPGYPLIPFVGEQRRKKNKVILGSQMKGFEAHEEKCVYPLSLVTRLSALWPSSSQACPGRFITALAPHIWSSTEFCFSKFL